MANKDRFEEFQKMAEGLVEMSKLPNAASLYIVQMRLVIGQTEVQYGL